MEIELNKILLNSHNRNMKESDARHDREFKFHDDKGDCTDHGVGNPIRD